MNKTMYTTMNTRHSSSPPRSGWPRGLAAGACNALLFAALWLLAPSSARAQQPLFTAPAGVIQSGNYATGMEFTTGSNPIYVTQLGYVDWNSSGSGFGDGLAGAGAQVGIWDMSGTLLASVTVPAGTATTQIGSYRYAALSSVLTLAPNTTYQILGYGWGSPENKWLIWQVAPSTVASYFGLSNLKTALHIGSFGNGNATWMTGNYTCGTANFIGSLTDPSAFHHITASVSGSGGTINPNGDVLVANGGSQTFMIAPTAHFAIYQVLVDGTNNPGAVTAGSYTFNGVTGDHTIVASFSALPTHTITASVSGAGGTISPSGAVGVDDGADQTFSITASPGGYTIADVVVDEVSQPEAVSTGTYTFSANSADHTITASFTAPPPHPQPMLISRGTGGWRTDTFTIGTTFTTGSDPVDVTKLGYVDRNHDGLLASHEVGIWQGGTLVVSATVPAETVGELIGDFRYVTLSAAVTLAANTTYTVGAYTEGDAWPDTLPNPGFGVPDFSGFTVGQIGELRGACWSQTGSFAQPTNHWSNSGPGNVAPAANLFGTAAPVADPFTAWINNPAFNTPTALTPEQKLSTADPDGDGMTNQQEFAFGLDPTKGTSVNPITAPLDMATGKFRYTRLAASGLAYHVFTSTDLQTWAEEVYPANETVTGTVDGVETVEVTVAATPVGGKRFVRVAAQ